MHTTQNATHTPNAGRAILALATCTDMPFTIAVARHAHASRHAQAGTHLALLTLLLPRSVAVLRWEPGTRTARLQRAGGLNED